MPEFQGTVLQTQMTRLEAQSKARDENIKYLTGLLQQIPGLVPAKRYEGNNRSNNHIYMMRYKAEEFAGLTRDKFIDALKAEGIPCLSGYAPIDFKKFVREAFTLNGRLRVYSNQCSCDDAGEHAAVARGARGRSPRTDGRPGATRARARPARGDRRERAVDGGSAKRAARVARPVPADEHERRRARARRRARGRRRRARRGRRELEPPHLGLLLAGADDEREPRAGRVPPGTTNEQETRRRASRSSHRVRRRARAPRAARRRPRRRAATFPRTSTRSQFSAVVAVAAERLAGQPRRDPRSAPDVLTRRDHADDLTVRDLALRRRRRARRRRRRGARRSRSPSSSPRRRR